MATEQAREDRRPICPSQAQLTPGELETCLLPLGHKGSHVGPSGGKWVSPDKPQPKKPVEEQA